MDTDLTAFLKSNHASLRRRRAATPLHRKSLHSAVFVMRFSPDTGWDASLSGYTMRSHLA